MSALDHIISPAEAVEKLLAKGVKVSERTLREKARAKGAYRQIGGAIFFLPEDLERIMEPETCSSPSNVRKVRTGISGARSTVSELSEAREKLASRKRQRLSPISSPNPSPVTITKTGEK